MKSVLDSRAVESLAKTQGHFFVIDIIAKTTCWLLMAVWLGGHRSAQKWNEREEKMCHFNNKQLKITAER